MLIRFAVNIKRQKLKIDVLVMVAIGGSFCWRVLLCDYLVQLKYEGNHHKNQYHNLFEEYKKEFNNEADTITLLNRVNLITPSNIHLNAFMYEPIIDMGDAELKHLYRAVKENLATS